VSRSSSGEGVLELTAAIEHSQKKVEHLASSLNPAKSSGNFCMLVCILVLLAGMTGSWWRHDMSLPSVSANRS
jgi:hypothetical protein